MTERNTAHATFAIEKTYAQPPSRVFSAWATETKKAAWFKAPAPAEVADRSFDFRVGGAERLDTRFESGAVHSFDATYHDIVADERIIYVYDMYVRDIRISVSIATVEFIADGTGTRMKFTEQAVFLDGFRDDGGRERGSRMLVEQLSAFLEQH